MSVENASTHDINNADVTSKIEMLREELREAHLDIIIIIIITSSGDLQPSTALANLLPGQLVSTQIRTTRPNCFKFIIALIMTSTNIV